MNRRHASSLIASALLSTGMLKAQAQSLSRRPIRLIAAFPAGATTDLIARMIAEKMSSSLGQTVIVENKPGASFGIALQEVMKAPPDGHTFCFITMAVAITPHLRPVPFDIVRDFTPITLTASTPYMLAVNASSPYKTAQEFLDAGRLRPNFFNYGSYGIGAPTHLAMEWLSAEAGSRLTHVPFKGSAEVINALLGGHIDAAFELPANVAPHVASGKLRLLGVTSKKSSSTFPSVPPLNTLYPGYEVDGWQGMLAPANTPKVIIDMLQLEISAALKQPDSQARMRDYNFDVRATSSEEFASIIQSDLARWGRLMKTNNITLKD